MKNPERALLAVVLLFIGGCAHRRGTSWVVANGLQMKPNDASPWKCVETGYRPDGTVVWRYGTDADPNWGCPHPWAKRAE